MTQKMRSEPSARWSWADAAFAALLLLAAVFLFYKCRYGFGNEDETFYLCLPYRLLQGDALLADEWHVSQLSGVLTLPLMAVYRALGGGAEGMVLAFRWLYTAFQVLAAGFVYLRLRRAGRLAAGAAALCFALYAPFGIMAFSYNSLGIANLMLSMVLVSTARWWQPLQTAVAGALLAAAVLCCPYLAALYGVYSLAVLCMRRRKPDPDGGLYWLTPRGWVWYTVGIAAVAAAFAGFVLSRASLESVRQALPQILADPEHAAPALVTRLKAYLRAILTCNDLAPAVWAASGALLVTAVVDKRRYEHAGAYLCVSAGLSAALTFPFLTERVYLNFLMFPLNLCGVFAFLTSRDRWVRRLFHTLWLPGMAYTLCIYLSSNQEFYAISSAATVATVGSAAMIGLAARDAWQGRRGKPLRRATAIALCALLAGQGAAEAVLRYESVFWDGPMDALVCRVDEGLEKGLLVTPNRLAEYQALLADTEAAREAEGPVLFVSEKTWLYLCTDARCGAYSAWLSVSSGNAAERLADYYALHPDRLPDAAYVEARYAPVADWLCQAYGYAREETALGFLLRR